MSFKLSLYLAPEGVGPMHRWSREHRQPLGTRLELQAAFDRLFRPIRWELTDTRAWACYPLDDSVNPREVFLFGKSDDVLAEVSVYSGPPAIRTIMTALGLNYCYAQESGKLYLPFATGEDWPNETTR